jgi:hypothetical protein
VLLLGVGVFVAVVAWAALVLTAIHFGRTARGGSSGGWVLLAISSAAAVGCLFLALLLVLALLRRGGVVAERSAHRH